MPTVLCPGCSRAIDLSAEEFCFAALDCGRCGTTFTPAEHLAPQVIPVPVPTPFAVPVRDLPLEPAEPAVQCFDCGRAVPMSSVVRRTVVTGEAETSGWRGDHYQTDTTTHTGRVNLCRRCAARRDEEAARQRRSTAAALAILAVLVAVAVALVVFVGLP
jgi:ribosomal protein S26